MLNFLTEIPFCPQNQSNLSVCPDLAPVTPTVSSPAVQSPAIVKPVSRVTRIPAVYLSNLVLVIQTRVGCMPAVKWRHMVSYFFVGFNVDFKAYISYLRNLPVYNLHYVIYLSIIFISPCVPPRRGSMYLPGRHGRRSSQGMLRARMYSRWQLPLHRGLYWIQV